MPKAGRWRLCRKSCSDYREQQYQKRSDPADGGPLLRRTGERSEKSLAGKIVGIIFRNEEWEFNNKRGWKAQPFKFIAASKIREGKFTLPKDKPLSNPTVPANTSGVPEGYVEIDDEDCPF